MDAASGIPRFLGDLPYYTSRCLKVRTKRAQVRPFVMNAAQLYVNAKLTEQRRQTGRVRAIILKARQMGVSTLVAGRFYRRLNLTPNVHAAVIADKATRAGGLFGMYQRFDRYLPPDLAPEKEANARGKHLVYKTLDTQITVETAGDPAAGRSATLQLVHASEMAFWPDAEDVHVAISQAIPDDDSEYIIESTAKGVGGLFYDMWTEAVEGRSGFIAIFLPWFIDPSYASVITEAERQEILGTEDKYERAALDVGFEFEGQMVRLTPEQLMWRRVTIRDKLRGDKRLFKQEYPSTPDEAFLTTGAMFFDEEKLLAYKATTVPPIMRCEIEWARGGVRFRPDSNGIVRIWRYPDRLMRCAMFGDTSTGKGVNNRVSIDDQLHEKGGSDFSAAFIGDLDTRCIVAAVHGRIPPETFARTLDGLSFLYAIAGATPTSPRPPALIGVERNHSSGETALRVLKDDLHHPNLYFHKTINKRTNDVTVELGWPMRIDTRAPMLDDAAAAIRNESVIIPDADLIREMFVFVRGDDGRPEAMDNLHDDRVIAFAGMLQMWRHMPAPATPLPTEEPVGSSPTGWADY